MCKQLLVIVLMLMTLCSRAQHAPLEGAKLNYRIVGFSFSTPTGGTYKLEVSKGNFSSEELFIKNIVAAVTTAEGRSMVTLPDWGADYTWRVKRTDKASAGAKDSFHHFSVVLTPYTDVNSVRLNVTQQASRYAAGFVFCDRPRVLYDMSGNPVWVLNDIAGIADEHAIIRDLKFTNKGTITFLSNDKPYEISYDGKILWSAPKNNRLTNDTVEKYHHEFTRMSNGHYMVCGTEQVQWVWKSIGPQDSSLFMATEQEIKKGTAGAGVKMPYGTVLELDEKGKIVWSWRSSVYYRTKDNGTQRKISNPIDVHQNAFYFDEKTKELLVSFKNTCQIIKVKYPTGKVEKVIGTDPMKSFSGAPVFCEQHACRVNKKGELYMFNNNTCTPVGLPTVLMVDMKTSKENDVKKIWEYNCPVNLGMRQRMPLTNGGNVTELPDESIFVSMCSPYGNLFIVNRNKELLWNASLDHWNLIRQQWEPCDEYRASMITDRVALEKAIWHGKNK